MNERIRELVEQTYLYDTYEMVDGEQQKVCGFTKNNVQKLADLILEDCMRVLETRKDHTVVVNAIKEIKEHFGVK